ncbi:MAG: hypothetical protein ACJ8F7_13500 [Gemmataceae bacterium]
MIAYRDFAPKELSATTWLSDPTFESFDQAIVAANEWIAAEQVDVVNMETVVLPLYSRAGKPVSGTNVAYVPVRQGDFWFGCVQFVRVWYRVRNR